MTNANLTSAEQRDVTIEKHAGGRPTAYKPEFCQTVIELGKEGAGPSKT